jgi:hypothetical protein
VVYETEIFPINYADLHGVPNPSVHFFGGQPGAGKSVAEDRIITELESVDGKNSIAEISIDNYRPQHTAYSQLLATDEENLGAYTNQDCWLWSERAKDYVLQLKPHVIREGTLRNPDQTLTDVGSYLESGFRAELHIVAVHEFISRLRYLSRYIDEVEYYGGGRLVPRSLHDEAYQQLPESVAAMTDARMFHKISIHNGNGHIIEEVELTDLDATRKTYMAVMSERDSGKMDKQALIRDIDQQLERAHLIGRPNIAEELQVLRNEVVEA